MTGVANFVKSSVLALHKISTGINLHANLESASFVSSTCSMIASPTLLTSTKGLIQSTNLIKMTPGTPISKTK